MTLGVMTADARFLCGWSFFTLSAIQPVAKNVCFFGAVYVQIFIVSPN